MFATLFAAFEPLHLILAACFVVVVCLVVFGSSPRTISKSSSFKKGRLAGLVIVGIAILGASLYYTHDLVQLQTLLWLGLISAVSAVVLFFLTLSSATDVESHFNLSRSSLFFLLYSIAIGCAIPSLSIVAITVATNPLNGAGGIGVAFVKRYTADIQIVGKTIVHESLVKPFTVSSGQLNFGCEQTVPAQVTYQLPGGANLVGSLSASWRNTSNVSHMEASSALQGDVARAMGTITGIQYQAILFVRNCPGGGHGELVLSGEYQTDNVREVSAPPQALTSAVSSATNKEDWITLPVSQGFEISDINVTIKAADGTTVSRFTVTPIKPVQSDGKFSVTYAPQRNNGQLLIRVQ